MVLSYKKPVKASSMFENFDVKKDRLDGSWQDLKSGKQPKINFV